MNRWPNNLYAVTLFVDDLEASRAWYQKAFGFPIAYEDEDSVAFDLRDTYLNLLRTPVAAQELVPSEEAATQASGNRFELTVLVDDVDAKCRELAEAGIELLIEPTDRHWGLRTASFKDPDGHIWEIAHNLPDVHPKGAVQETVGAQA